MLSEFFIAPHAANIQRSGKLFTACKELSLRNVFLLIHHARIFNDFPVIHILG